MNKKIIIIILIIVIVFIAILSFIIPVRKEEKEEKWVTNGPSSFYNAGLYYNYYNIYGIKIKHEYALNSNNM